MFRRMLLFLTVILLGLLLALGSCTPGDAMPDADGHGVASEPGEDHADKPGEIEHGEPAVGYIGLENRETIPESDLAEWHDKVAEEAYRKGTVDQIRLIFFALSFIVVFLAFAKIKRLEPLSRVLREAVDWYTLGTISGIILIALVIPSGIVITLYYMPTATEAYYSVEFMTTRPVLAFFRNLHNWSSEVFLWLMILHAARTVSTRSFLGNRKFIWLTGAVAFVVGWVAFLTGSFMRGDQEALEGFVHMMYSFTLVPLGKYVAGFFTGELTLIRLTTIHIIATVFVIAVLLALHVLMRKVHVHVVKRWRKAVIYSAALTIFMVVQSIVMEAPFIRGMEVAPTVSGIETTKPPWPIYFLIQGENWFGANAMVAILAVAFLPLIAFPYVIELLPLPAPTKSRVGAIVFYAGVFLMILVSYIGAAGRIQAHIFM